MGSIPRAEKFGDLITADHKVLNEGSGSQNNHQYAVVVQDLATFWESFKGPSIPFGALVEYLPNSERDKAKFHQFGKKVLPGIFLRYALIAARIWKGDILIADFEELEKLDASEKNPRRLKCKRSPDIRQ